MEARGFGAPVRRTWTRPSPWRGIDTAAVLIGLTISVLALTAALLTGSFRGVID